MEATVPCNTSACPDINRNIGISKDSNNSTHYISGNLSMNDLKTCLSEFLNDGDSKTSSGSNMSSWKNDLDNVVVRDDNKDLNKRKSSPYASEKGFSRCVTFPPLGESKTSALGLRGGEKKQEDGETAQVSEAKGFAELVDHCYKRSMSLPTPLKLVSAMKGGREKQGVACEKLTVTWASDVYDPTPTAASHVPSSKNQCHRSNGKKYGRNKQKGGGKSSSGSKGKDKKQCQKNNVGTNKYFKTIHDGSQEEGFYEPQARGIDEPQVCNVDEPQACAVGFDVESPDPFCGSSFLKKSVATLHFPLAEAT